MPEGTCKRGMQALQTVKKSGLLSPSNSLSEPPSLSSLSPVKMWFFPSFSKKVYDSHMPMIWTQRRSASSSSLFVRSRKGSLRNLARKRKKKKITEYPRHMRRGQRRKQDKLKTILNRLRNHLFSPGNLHSSPSSAHPSLRLFTHRRRENFLSPRCFFFSFFANPLVSSYHRYSHPLSSLLSYPSFSSRISSSSCLPSHRPRASFSLFSPSTSLRPARTARTPSITTSIISTTGPCFPPSSPSYSQPDSSVVSCQYSGVSARKDRMELRSRSGRCLTFCHRQIDRGSIHADTVRQRHVETLDSSRGTDRENKPSLQELLLLLPSILRRLSLPCSFLFPSPSSPSCSPCFSFSFSLPSLFHEYQRLFFSLHSSYISCMHSFFSSFLRNLSIQALTFQRRADETSIDRHLLSHSISLPILSSLSSFSCLSPSLNSRLRKTEEDERVSSIHLTPSSLISLSCSSYPYWQALTDTTSIDRHFYGSSSIALHLTPTSRHLPNVHLFPRFAQPCLSFFDRDLCRQSFSPSSFSLPKSFSSKCFFSSSALARRQDPIIHKTDQTSLSSSSSHFSAQRDRESHEREVRRDGSSSDIVRGSQHGVYRGEEDAGGRRKEGGEEEQGSGTIELLGPVALSRTILKAFREEDRNPILWRRFARRARLLLPVFTPPSSLIHILGMFGTLGYRDQDFLAEAIKILLPQLAVCTARDLCRVTHVYAQLHARHDLFFSVCAREISRRAHELEPHEMARILHSYTRLRYFHPHLFAVLRRRMFENIKRLEPGALVLILSSLSRLHLYDEKLLSVLYTEVCRRIGDMNVRGLSILANTYNEIAVEHPILYDLLIDEAYRKRHERKPQDAVLMLRAIAGGGGGSMKMFHTYKKSKRHVTFLLHLLQDLPRHIKYFTLEQVSMTVAALSRLYTEIKRDALDEWGRGGDSKSIEVWGEGRRSLGEKDNSTNKKKNKKDRQLYYYSLKDIFMLEESQAVAESQQEEEDGTSLDRMDSREHHPDTRHLKIRRREHPLLEALGDRIGDLSKDLTPQSTAALVYAYAKLNYRHGPLLYHAPEHLERHADDYSLDQLAKMCFAYSKLQIPNTSVLEITLKELTKRLGEGEEEKQGVEKNKKQNRREEGTGRSLSMSEEETGKMSEVFDGEERRIILTPSDSIKKKEEQTDVKVEEKRRHNEEEEEKEEEENSSEIISLKKGKRRCGALNHGNQEDFCDLSRRVESAYQAQEAHSQQEGASRRSQDYQSHYIRSHANFAQPQRTGLSSNGMAPRRKSQSRLVRQYVGDLSQFLTPFSSSSCSPSVSSSPYGRSTESFPSQEDDQGNQTTDAPARKEGSCLTSSSISSSTSFSSFSLEPDVEVQLPGGLSPAFLKALVKVDARGLPEENRALIKQETGRRGEGDMERPKLHSLTRILQAMLRLNVFDRKALSLVGDHLASRASEMPSFMFPALVELLGGLGFLHQGLMDSIRFELKDPREDVHFNQAQLRRLYEALLYRLQLSPADFGVIRLPRSAIANAADSSRRETLTWALLRAARHVDPNGAESYTSYLEEPHRSYDNLYDKRSAHSMSSSTSPSVSVPSAMEDDSMEEHSEAAARLQDGGVKVEEEWVYFHVPLYLEKLMKPEVQQAISTVVEDVEAMEAELMSYDFPVAYTTASSGGKKVAEGV
ncbi:atp-dependent rna [Cystoisospora suis]|uniref:Atp-dependent rna n=1 Tax=Cystoisospora suis TaxID=483139 RepID=A0A2C6L2B1_9APIC|nr:atp-dependent rna [Cystoisospora suis]